MFQIRIALAGPAIEMQEIGCRNGGRKIRQRFMEALSLECDLEWEAGALESRSVSEAGRERMEVVGSSVLCNWTLYIQNVKQI